MAVFKRLALSSIFVGDRARPVDEDHAQAIAASMAERGLINPITVRSTPARKGTPYTLVAGGHRIRGATINAWDEIDTIVVEADAVEAQLIEISENLYRNELNPLDRALFVLKFREMWEEKNGAINPNGGRPKKQGNDYPDIFAAGRDLSTQVCNRLGFGKETYKKVNQIGQNLHPALRQAVRGTIAETDQTKLLKLARLPGDDQVRIAAALREMPDFARVWSMFKGPKPEVDPQEQVFDRLATAWLAADEGTRRRFLDHIGDQADFSFLEAAQ